MIDLLMPLWKQDRFISLRLLNLSRRLSQSKTKSIRKLQPQVELPSEDVLKLRKLFDEADVDGTAEIDKDELREALRKMGMKCTPSEIDEMMREIDVDGSGTIAWPEFLWMMS